jgi:hypothetical protein
MVFDGARHASVLAHADAQPQRGRLFFGKTLHSTGCGSAAVAPRL